MVHIPEFRPIGPKPDAPPPSQKPQGRSTIEVYNHGDAASKLIPGPPEAPPLEYHKHSAFGGYVKTEKLPGREEPAVPKAPSGQRITEGVKPKPACCRLDKWPEAARWTEAKPNDVELDWRHATSYILDTSPERIRLREQEQRLEAAYQKGLLEGRRLDKSSILQIMVCLYLAAAGLLICHHLGLL